MRKTKIPYLDRSYIYDLDSNKQRELSYLIGSFLGDGCVYSNGNSYQFSITSEDRDICERCQQICEDIFGITGHIKDINRNGRYSYSQLVICSRPLVSLFREICPDRGIIPDLCFLSQENRLSFCQGIMDTDGWISKVKASDGYLRFRVAFKNTANWVPLVKSIMNDLGVSTGNVRRIESNRNGRSCKPAFEISINSQQYCKLIGFRCCKKNNLAKECLIHYG